MEKVADAIVSSLRCRPEDWEYTGFSLYNSQKRTRIWVANGRSFLDVEVDNENVLGGMTLIPLAPWRWRVWSAAQDIMRRGSTIDRRLQATVDKYWPSQV